MKIQIQNLVKKFDQNTVVDDVSLDIESGEFFFLLGPSGCGKTTLLRMLAGFFPPDAGTIRFGEKDVSSIPANKRNCALVFQNYALWPHMTVFENVAYGLRMRKIPEPELRLRVEEALAQVRMTPQSSRKPTTLSGGQQQRVALARAIVVKPDLLLFDEPLSNLDAKLRLEMREEIRRLHSLTKITSIYVTHDQEEALSMAKRIAVLNQGKVQQVGSPMNLYETPKNPFVAAFMGEVNLYSASESILGKKLTEWAEVEPRGTIGFRPENIHFVSENGWPARVESSSYLGSRHLVTLKTPEGETIHATCSTLHPEGTSVLFALERRHVLHYPGDNFAN